MSEIVSAMQRSGGSRVFESYCVESLVRCVRGTDTDTALELVPGGSVYVQTNSGPWIYRVAARACKRHQTYSARAEFFEMDSVCRMVATDLPRLDAGLDAAVRANPDTLMFVRPPPSACCEVDFKKLVEDELACALLCRSFFCFFLARSKLF
jgi:hypothetical protein